MKPTLLVLAAGLGSRYGGLKQLDGIGPDNQIIMDYSIKDALDAGFGKVVLIVQEKMVDILTDRYITQKNLPVEFVIQNKELTLDGNTYLNQKPWGTAHALWCAKDVVKENFLMINADDFYGRNSYQLAFDHLSTSTDPCAIVYPILKTLSENGTVNRAEVTITDGFLSDSVEREKISNQNGIISYKDPENGDVELPNDCFVSMNMFGFTTKIFDFIDTDIFDFIQRWKENNGMEYQLPNVVAKMIKAGLYQVKVIKTNEEWIGITYQSDKEIAQQKLAHLHQIGVY